MSNVAHLDLNEQIGNRLTPVPSHSSLRPITHKASKASFNNPNPGINVATAEEDFNALSRELSNLSRTASRRAAENNHDPDNIGVIADKDLEAGRFSHAEDGSTTQADDEPFNLEEVLRGNVDADRDAGIRPKRIGVLFNDLTAKGWGGIKHKIKVFPNAFVDFFNVYGTFKQLAGFTGGTEVKIIQGFHGVVRPGEMVLVLGKPGSGCTTFLKTIANKRKDYTNVDGEVMYGPFDAKTFDRLYRGEACYNAEDDDHLPAISVKQTLDFAVDTKTPNKLPGNLTKVEFRDKVVATLLKMFNIEHTRDTLVGGTPVIRGISGGERKRVSIAEMMATRGTVYSWDNSTRGLDASTALDFAKSLRIMTDLYQTTTFVSLYQASENIYKQFDKVLVIDSGRQVYFGPAESARAYFEGLGFAPKPRQTTPDYLTGCTDEFERDYAEGRDHTNAPASPEDLEREWRNSKIHKDLEGEMASYKAELEALTSQHEDFKAAVLDEKRSLTSKKSVYTISFPSQIAILFRRQMFLKFQDTFNLKVKWFTQIVIALITGSLFFKMPETSAGAFLRGGVLFITFLFNSLSAFSELPATMMGRPLMSKHKAYAFHRPSALWLAQLAVDMIFAAAHIMAFAIIVYFMSGLRLDAGAFFSFYIIIIMGYLKLTLFFRTLGVISIDYDYAIKLVATLITIFVVTCGYLIPYQATPVWLRWLFWTNGLGLGFSALMENEFKGIDLTCANQQLIPSGPGYDDPNFQVCTLPGTLPGSNTISGSRYIETQFSYFPSDQWRNFGLLIAWSIFFLILNTWLGDAIEFGTSGMSLTFFTRENKERKKLNEKLTEKRAAARQKRYDTHTTGSEAESTSDIKILSKAVLTWENLCYDVPVPGGQRRLLDHVFGYVKPGELTALVGQSGAGKTTLLDVLAARKNVGVISGDILIDSKKPGTSFARDTAYAEQLDVHEPMQTVREALRFSAYLRQGYDVPVEEKEKYVEEVIHLLELEDIADAVIGGHGMGLTVEQRKRVTIGVELAARPQLLLFLDEPTSGLDSQSAYNIVRFLRKLAAAGQAILCTIHQPNANLFEQFDRLLLLQSGGQTIYFGDIGKDASVLREYLKRYGAECPPDQNVAEFVLEAIGAGQSPRIGNKDWHEIWKDSPEYKATCQEVVRLRETRAEEAAKEEPNKSLDLEYATPVWYQIKVVTARAQKSFWRTPNYGFTRLFNHFIVAFLTGLIFMSLDNSRSSLQYRIFVIFQVTVLPVLIMSQVEPKYDIARMIFYRENFSKIYSALPFCISMIIAEVPYSILCAVIFFLPIYYIPGLRHETSRAGYQFFMVVITEFFSVTLGQLVAAVTPNAFIASLFNPFVIVTFALFCGSVAPKPQIPKPWQWLYELNPFTRLVGGMLVTELHGSPIRCKTSELNVFNPPNGTTCGDYAAAFMKTATGYIVNSNATSQCEYCAYSVGDEFTDSLNLSFGNRWRDLGILASFIFSNVILLLLAARYLNFARR